MMRYDTPHAIDVIASGIHDSKNTMFDALARATVVASAIPESNTDAHEAMLGLKVAISRSADRLSKSLSAYRLLRHENPVTMLPVDVHDLLDDVMVRVMDGAPPAVDVELTVSYNGTWIMDRQMIEDSVVNALHNALRFAKSKVRVSAALTGKEWLRLALCVADDGPGYPEVAPDHVDGTHSGVGLYIARRIAHLHYFHGHRGKLELGADVNLGGALFRMVLP